MPANQPSVNAIAKRARELGAILPAFNIPYLPMMEPVVQAVADTNSFALIETARLEWLKFGSQSAAAVAAEFARWARPAHVRLHLDHVPVIDEDNLRVDYLPVFREALALGYESVMIDGSRLPLEENIQAVRAVTELAHRAGVPVEAELGAVLGHEAGPLPPYEELFASGQGFTAVEEARRFAAETGCDWLSVAIGNIHGAISGLAKDQKKVEARLSLDHLAKLRQATGVPLVLHGGSGVRRDDVLAPGGGKVGMTRAQLAALYPALEAEPHTYTDGQYLRIADPAGGKGVLVFEVDGTGEVDEVTERLLAALA